MQGLLKNNRFVITTILLCIFVPLLLVAGILIFGDRQYYVISIGIVLLSCLPFFVRFEHKKPQPREILLIAVMAGVSVAGRCLFFVIPGFKPVAAITAITGFALGAEVGFLTGALSALVSNIFFGQGPWTPFQMFAWGMIGFFAGLVGRKGQVPSKFTLILFGIFAGIFFSLGMDVWGTMSTTGVFTLEAYILAIGTAIPFTIVYAISNVIFLLLLTRPIMEKLQRMKKKYGIFSEAERLNVKRSE